MFQTGSSYSNCRRHLKTDAFSTCKHKKDLTRLHPLHNIKMQFKRKNTSFSLNLLSENRENNAFHKNAMETVNNTDW